MLSRRHARPRAVGLRAFLSERGSNVLTVRWSSVGMYRYSQNKRLRAAFLCDLRLNRWRG